MTTFSEFVRERLAAGGFSTEDALASFLPLAQEAREAHSSGLVAPLEGVADLSVDGIRIWFEEAKRRPPRRDARVRKIEISNRAAVEVVSEARVTTDVEDGRRTIVDLAIGDPDQPILRPCYLTGYQAWEHRVGNHDPLTDVFSLGMILASMACGLDLSDGVSVERFVANRANLFALAPQLHPVIARTIVRMTEVDRRRRAPDLISLIYTIENYRDQDVDFETELAATTDYSQCNKRDKRTVVLAKLRERLFEISRRNRLLHFRPTMQSINLTHASVPLSFDVKSIRPDQILTWSGDLEQAAASGKRISLSKYLNFSEVLYLPSQLQRLIADARRDRLEFGFAQLRLVACFLHWANLKEKPFEQYESPLVLLPVELRKKKGIRDTYWLELAGAEAEINPVVRHQFKQLYDIALPETIDLAHTTLHEFLEKLSKEIDQSDEAVKLAKIDRPRINLIHEKARRRLDQYQRRARVAGKGVRQFLDLDYSYDPANYHPLGIKLYAAMVRPPSTHLREIIEQSPRPRKFAAPEPEPPVVESQRQFYQLQSGAEASPYDWTFDLCSVTLANFRYRRMSLVRDYEELLADDQSNPAFDAVFSLSARSAARDLLEPRPFSDRFDVLPCDPTQAHAIAEAADEKSYIIQGPPGTGKSQTIANLIADFVARGKRVLFVCEKRAAIDVVYARLKQRGLDPLCCLIHDSQTDKKGFVMDLKRTYDRFAARSGFNDQLATDLSTVLDRLQSGLQPLEEFDHLMQSTPAEAGTTVRRLIERCISLRSDLPELDAVTKESLPTHAQWVGCGAAIQKFQQALRDAGGEPILARHPLRILAARLASVQRPLQTIVPAASTACIALEAVEGIFRRTGLPQQQWEQFDRAGALADYASRVAGIAAMGKLSLLDEASDEAQWFASETTRFESAKQAATQAADENTHWIDKLSPEETAAALERAAAWENSSLAWLRPEWWRLRSVLTKYYDFRAHRIKPTWTRVLSLLHEEHEARSMLEDRLLETSKRLDLDRDAAEELVCAAGDLDAWLPLQPRWLREVHGALLASDRGDEAIRRLNEGVAPLATAAAALAELSDDAAQFTLHEIKESLQLIINQPESAGDFLYALRELDSAPASVRWALRELPHRPIEIEAAVADHTLATTLRSSRQVERFNAKALRRQSEQLESDYDRWLDLNAGEVLQSVRRRFVASMHLSEAPTASLTPVQKVFKKHYNRGRRELEHEFGKQMRCKAIRDLVAAESGQVVKDLKPVWLMSPLSVSDTLPLDSDFFDLVIFDEASQITLEDATPALCRAPQSIVVGDEMQLPPTDFFSVKHTDEDGEETLVESDGELVRYDLDAGSFLSHAAKNLPSTMLGWHYRSRSESLISFSNWAFYDGRLLTPPEENLVGAAPAPIVATAASDGVSGAAETLCRAISFHCIPSAVYDKRRNRGEAEYIAEMVRALLQDELRRTVGIVAFSEAQQDEIEQALGRLAEDDKTFRDLLETEYEREDDGQYVGLLVKNLENIQGDERDVIILSVCYGRPPTGKMRMNFGPINKSGGEKRLNVAFSRAKRHMAVVSSISSTEITNDYNDGANCLKNYLRYAEAASVGDASTTQRILHEMSRWRDRAEADAAPQDVVTQQISEALSELGYRVERSVGQSHFQIDLAVYREGDAQYRLGILVDTEAYYSQVDLVERDMMRPRLLRAFGWRVVQVLGKDWYADPDNVVRGLVELIDE